MIYDGRGTQRVREAAVTQLIVGNSGTVKEWRLAMARRATPNGSCWGPWKFKFIWLYSSSRPTELEDIQTNGTLEIKAGIRDVTKEVGRRRHHDSDQRLDQTWLSDWRQIE